jgi:signal transduction histidine kinase
MDPTAAMSPSHPLHAALTTRLDSRAAFSLAFSYAVLMIASIALKPGLSIPSALWPPMALEFCAYLILPTIQWPAIAAIQMLLDLASVVPVILVATGKFPSLGYMVILSLTSTLECVGMVLACRASRLALSDDEPVALMAPLLLFGLPLGALPGNYLTAWAHAVAAGQPLNVLDVAIRCLSATLTVVALCPLVLGLLRGFDQSIRGLAGPKEKAFIGCAFGALCVLYFGIPWHLDRFLELMLLAGPMLWLSLRCSQRAVAVVCAAVAIGIGIACAHGIGFLPPLVSVGTWRDGIMSAQLFLLVICGEAILINRIVLKERALLKDSKRKEAMLAAYCKALDETEDRTRREAARDLHDGVSQIIAGQCMILGALRRRIADPQLCEMVDQAAAASKEAQSTVRTTIEDLSPPELDHASMPELLTWLTSFFAQRYGFGVTWRLAGDPAAATGDSGLIYKTLRELIFNAYKHSQVDVVEVTVTSDSSGTRISVIDEGIGFEPQAPAADGRLRFGLSHVTERIAVAGGWLDIESSVGQGCAITVHLPPASAGAPHEPVVRSRESPAAA